MLDINPSNLPPSPPASEIDSTEVAPNPALFHLLLSSLPPTPPTPLQTLISNVDTSTSPFLQSLISTTLSSPTTLSSVLETLRSHDATSTRPMSEMEEPELEGVLEYVEGLQAATEKIKEWFEKAEEVRGGDRQSQRSSDTANVSVGN